MPRTRARWMAFVLLVSLLGGGTAMAGELGFSGGVGLEVSYTPIPPASFNIEADLSLGFDVDGFSFATVTGFDLFGFQSEEVTLSLDLGAVQLGEEIRFEPTFSWNELSVDLGIVGVQLGVDWILANIGSVQTPDYSMGAVVEISSGIVCGFSIATLTGFGAVDLVNLLGGVEAPFSYELLGLFHYLDTLCVPAVQSDATIVDGFYFEEALVRLRMDFLGMIASCTTWFDYQGLSQILLELGYRFEEPSLSFLTSMTLDGSFTITGLDFIVDLAIDVVRFTSHTSFAEAAPPAPIPIVFGGQAFAVSFEILNVVVTSETSFDGTFLFAEETIAIDAAIDPVTFRSLTTFDAWGFARECVYAGVTFSGAELYTRAEFDASGIESVTFGFKLHF